MKWLRTIFGGLDSGDLRLFSGDMVIHFRTPFLTPDNPQILDFWLMRNPAQLWITNKEEQFPPGFELHPTEACESLARVMLRKLAGGWKPKEIVHTPNIWRVLAGDRVVAIGQRPWLEDGELHSFFDFEKSALVYWLRQDGSMPRIEEICGAAPAEGDTKCQEIMRRAFTKVRALGVPRVFEENWRLG